MSPRIRLPKRNKFFTLRKPARVERTIVLTTAAVTSVIYFTAVAAGAVQIYKHGKQNDFTRVMEAVFPYPAAIVDHEPIYLTRFRDEVESRVAYATRHNTPVNIKDIESYVTEQLINRTLYAHELNRRGIKITQTEVEEQYKKVEQEAGGEEKLIAFLQEQYGPDVTLTQFKQWVEESLYEAVLKQKLLTHVQVNHILIALPQDATPEKTEVARARAQEVRNKITSQDQFAAMAKEYSDDVATRDKGGLLGETGRDGVADQFSTEFETAIFSQKIGEVSQPIRTKYGWHLAMIDKREGSINKGIVEFTKELRQRTAIATLVKQ